MINDHSKIHHLGFPGKSRVMGLQSFPAQEGAQGRRPLSKEWGTNICIMKHKLCIRGHLFIVEARIYLNSLANILN